MFGGKISEKKWTPFDFSKDRNCKIYNYACGICSKDYYKSLEFLPARIVKITNEYFYYYDY